MVVFGFFSGVFGFINIYVILIVFQKIGWKIYIIFLILYFLEWVLMYFVIVEIKGCFFEEIDEIFKSVDFVKIFKQRYEVYIKDGVGVIVDLGVKEV